LRCGCGCDANVRQHRGSKHRGSIQAAVKAKTLRGHILLVVRAVRNNRPSRPSKEQLARLHRLLSRSGRKADDRLDVVLPTLWRARRSVPGRGVGVRCTSCAPALGLDHDRRVYQSARTMVGHETIQRANRRRDATAPSSPTSMAPSASARTTSC